MDLPTQIKDFGFCLVRAREKRPFELAWQKTPYKIDDPKFQLHLQNGGNYGVICSGGVVVLDVDAIEEFTSKVDYAEIPDTFTVKTGGGGYHFYFLAPGVEEKIVLKNGSGRHLGELQAGGAQVVGPGCIHPSGNTYDVVNNVPIAGISSQELMDLLAPVIPQRNTRARIEETLETGYDDPFKGVSILDVINTTGFTKSGDQLFGTHPIHGSDTGHNLVINPAKNTWWCGRCESGGGPALWLAVESRLIHCDEAGPGVLRGARFQEVLSYARQRGIIADEPKAESVAEPEAKPSCPIFTKKDFGFWVKVDKKLRDEMGKPQTDEAGKQITIQEDKYEFSRDKAKLSIMEKMKLATDRTGKDIYWFDGEIYQKTGEPKIRSLLYTVAGDHTSRPAVVEVVNRIQADLVLSPVDFNPRPFLMPLQNGVVDLETGEIRPYEAEDMFTFKYPAHYDPTGGDWKLVLWQLCSTLPGPHDVLQAIDLMASVPLRVPFNVWALFFGGGSNGKGNFEDMLAAFVGPDRTSGMTLDELKASRFGAGELLDVDLLIVSEVEGVKGATNAMKKLATGEFLDSDVKYGARRKGRPHLLTILDANNAFDYGDDSFGRQRRTIKLDFPYTFGDGPGDRPIDPRMKEKITSPAALSGMVSIIMARAPELIATRRIYRPKSIADMEAEYDIQRFPKKYFVESCIAEVDYDDFEWKAMAGGKDRLDMPDAVAEFKDYCRRFNVPLSGDDRLISQELGSYIAKVFEKKSVHTSKSIDGKTIHYRYYPGIWLKRTAEGAYSDYILSRNTSLTTPTTPLRQLGRIEIDISKYITTATTPTTAISLNDIIGEILKMYMFIHSTSCEITYRNYLQNPVVGVVGVVEGRYTLISTGKGDVKAVVEGGRADVKMPSLISQVLADHIRKGTPIRTRDYPDIDELEMLEALDAGGWTEKRGVWWPPSEEKR
jgi:phage/plasmid-associated DNA primase